MSKFGLYKFTAVLIIVFTCGPLYGVDLKALDANTVFSYRFCASYISEHIDTFNQWQVLWFSEKKETSITNRYLRLSQENGTKSTLIEKTNALLLDIVEAQYEITNLSDSYSDVRKECQNKKMKRYSRAETDALSSIESTIEAWRLRLLELQRNVSGHIKKVYGIEAARSLVDQALSVEKTRLSSLASIEDLMSSSFKKGEELHYLTYKINRLTQMLHPNSSLEKMIRNHVHFHSLEKIYTIEKNLETAQEYLNSLKAPTIVADSLGSKIDHLKSVNKENLKVVQKSSWRQKRTLQIKKLDDLTQNNNCTSEARQIKDLMGVSARSFRANEMRIIGLLTRCKK